MLRAMQPMSIGTSIFLIVVGAILRYAITADPNDVDLDVIGLILMIAGFAGLAFSVLFMLISSGGRNDDRDQQDPYDRRPPPPPPPPPPR